MPGLVHDAQNSRGAISATFKLYNDLNAVCDSLDSLVSALSLHDNSPLPNDLSAMLRIREELSSYIQTAASSLETRGKVPYPLVSSVSGQFPKKIIIDDNDPDPKPPKKKVAQR
jgi:hypothetical protein